MDNERLHSDLEQDLGETTPAADRSEVCTKLLCRALDPSFKTTELAKAIDAPPWSLTRPGEIMRDLIRTWSAALRRAQRARAKKSRKEAKETKSTRQMLDRALKDVSRKLNKWSGTAVKNLGEKVSGTEPASARDAYRLLTALVATWPEDLSRPLEPSFGTSVGRTRLEPQRAAQAAARLLAALLSGLTKDASLNWASSPDDKKQGFPEEQGFRFRNEERKPITELFREAAAEKGGLITAAAEDLFILDADPAAALKAFRGVYSEFSDDKGEGLVIFLFSGDFLKQDNAQYRRLFDVGFLGTALLTQALHDATSLAGLSDPPDIDHKRWREFCKRCSIVMARPPLFDPRTGRRIGYEEADSYLARLAGPARWEKLGRSPIPIESLERYVLPDRLPDGLDDVRALGGRRYHVNVRARFVDREFKPTYYVLPEQPIELAAERKSKRRGRPALRPIEGDTAFFVGRQPTDKPESYDDAYKKVYLAAKGRLAPFRETDGAASPDERQAILELRESGFEVFPVPIALRFLADVFASAGQDTAPEGHSNLNQSMPERT